MRMRCRKVPAFSMRAMVMREQPIIGATSRHLKIFIDAKSSMTRIPFNLLGARMSSARWLGTQFGASGFGMEGASRRSMIATAISKKSSRRSNYGAAGSIKF